MMTQMERMSTQLNERLVGNQNQFHQDVKGVYTDLALSVDTSLRNSLSQGAQIAGELLQPAVDAALNGIAAQAQLMHERMASTVQLQLDGLTERFGTTAATVSATGRCRWPGKPAPTPNWWVAWSALWARLPTPLRNALARWSPR